ncbi:MAG: hypothetical protein NC397_10460 [Clostridium sp.]|nr:hypothetical protein [Clostridium sp.]
MFHLHFSKKVKTFIVAILCLIFAGCLACVCLFFSSTIDDLEGFCQENSFRNATKFDIESTSDLSGYIFAVSQNGDESQGQELFVFREKSFGIVKNTDRFVLEYQSDKNASADVGSYMFKPYVNDKKSDENYLVFYSDNSIGAVQAKLITSYNENGKDIETKVNYSLTPTRSFICVSTPLKPMEQIESACFENMDSKVVFTY